MNRFDIVPARMLDTTTEVKQKRYMYNKRLVLRQEDYATLSRHERRSAGIYSKIKIVTNVAQYSSRF